jgi:hypothetical protein
MRLRAAWLSLIRCDLDLRELRVRVLTVAAMPDWQSSMKKTKAMIGPQKAERFPKLNFLYPSPEFTCSTLHETGQ